MLKKSIFRVGLAAVKNNDHHRSAQVMRLFNVKRYVQAYALIYLS